MQNPSKYLSEAYVTLSSLQEKGKKIVGYYPSEYVPEELILAAKMVPLGLAKGGDFGTLLHSGRAIPRWEDTFCRSQVGSMLMGDPYYSMVDLYVNIASHFESRIVADNYSFYFPDLDMFRSEVPHDKSAIGLKYYTNMLYAFKNKLEAVSGNSITEENLRKAINLCNKERELLRELNLMRKEANLTLTGLDFTLLTHASYMLDKELLIQLLEETKSKVKQNGSAREPRITLTGSALAMSDYQVYRLVQQYGGEIVIEQFSEAIRDFWDDVDNEGDLDQLLRNVAERYFMKKVCSFAFRPSKERRDFIYKLHADFKSDGIIWYQPMYQSNADFDYELFALQAEKKNIPLLKIYTEYDSIEESSNETRIETFLKVLKQR